MSITVGECLLISARINRVIDKLASKQNFRPVYLKAAIETAIIHAIDNRDYSMLEKYGISITNFRLAEEMVYDISSMSDRAMKILNFIIEDCNLEA